MTYCHLHNKQNEHVATGKGSTRSKAATEAITNADVPDLEQSTMGCGETQDKAHKRAGGDM